MKTFEESLERLRRWFDSRNQRERWLLVLAGWAIISLAWNIFILRPMTLQKKQIVANINDLSLQIQSLNDEQNAITGIVTKYSIGSKLKVQQNLMAQSQALKN